MDEFKGVGTMKRDKIKGFIAGITAMMLVLSMSLTVYAVSETKSIKASYNNIKLYVDQRIITPKDANGTIVEPFIYNGTAYLPVRAAAEALGQEVSWDGATKSIYIGKKPAALPTAPFTLAAGQYIVGEDIPAGKYNCTAVSGGGNFIGDVASLGRTGLNEILGAPGSYYADRPSYSNLRLADGDMIKINGNLKVEFTL